MEVRSKFMRNVKFTRNSCSPVTARSRLSTINSRRLLTNASEKLKRGEAISVILEECGNLAQEQQSQRQEET